MSSAGCSRFSTRSATIPSGSRRSDRLSILLEVHADAEERLLYPRLLDVGEGAGVPASGDETTDALRDHNEIRTASGT